MKSSIKIETIKYIIVCMFLIFLSGCSHEEDQQVVSSMQERDSITQTGAMNSKTATGKVDNSKILNVNLIINDGYTVQITGGQSNYFNISDAEIQEAWNIFLTTTHSFDMANKVTYKLNILRDPNFSKSQMSSDVQILMNNIVGIGLSDTNIQSGWKNFFTLKGKPNTINANILIGKFGAIKSPDASHLISTDFKYDGTKMNYKAGYGVANVGFFYGIDHKYELAQTISYMLGARPHTTTYGYGSFYDIVGVGNKAKFRLSEHRSKNNIKTIRESLNIKY